MVWPSNDLDIDLQGQMSRSLDVRTTNRSYMLKGLKIWEKLIFDIFDLEMTLTLTFKVKYQGHLNWLKVQTKNCSNVFKFVKSVWKLIFSLFDINLT